MARSWVCVTNFLPKETIAMTELAELVSTRIRKLPGIVNTDTLIAFRVFTYEERVAGESLGLD